MAVRATQLLAEFARRVTGPPSDLTRATTLLPEVAQSVVPDRVRATAAWVEVGRQAAPAVQATSVLTEVARENPDGSPQLVGLREVQHGLVVVAGGTAEALREVQHGLVVVADHAPTPLYEAQDGLVIVADFLALVVDLREIQHGLVIVATLPAANRLRTWARMLG